MTAKKDPNLLSPGQRALAAAISVIALLLLVVQQFVTVSVTAAAPACDKAPAGCVVQVTRAIDPALAVALLAVFGFAAIIAATGRMWKLTSPAVGLEPTAQVPDETPEAKTAKKKAATSKNKTVDALPIPVKIAAETQWQEWFQQPLADSFVADAGVAGGSHYFTATPPGATDAQVFKVG